MCVGHKEVVELLLAAKANPNIKNKVFYLFHFLWGRKLELLSTQANPNIKDKVFYFILFFVGEEELVGERVQREEVKTTRKRRRGIIDCPSH